MQRRDYLSFLPGLFKRQSFRAQAEGPVPSAPASFLEAYLEVWQALLSEPEPPRASDNSDLWPPAAAQASLGAVIQALPGLFHPRLSPAFLPDDPRFLPPLDEPPTTPTQAQSPSAVPSPELVARQHLLRLLGVTDLDAWLATYFEWYGELLATPVPRGWELDQKRNLLARVLPVYRLRGTAAGLRQLLELLVRGEQASNLPRAITASTEGALESAEAPSAAQAAPDPASASHLTDLVQRALSEPDARLFLEDRIRTLYAQLYGPDPGSYQEVIARVQARNTATEPAPGAPQAPSSPVLAVTSALASAPSGDLGLPKLVVPKPVPAKELPLVEVLDGSLGRADVFRLDRARLLPALPARELDGFELGQFQVVVTEPTRQIPRLLRVERWLTRVVEAEKPLSTRFRLRLRTPTLVVGDSHIGIDTVLGDVRVPPAPASARGGS